MAAVTLEHIFDELKELKKEVRQLKECFHEDILELNAQTQKDIDESRKQIKDGKSIPFEQL